MTAFTPGPWRPYKPRKRENLTVQPICGVYDYGYSRCYVIPTKENDLLGGLMANARLIAAAPDLYAVLAELEESAEYGAFHFPDGLEARINAALKRARGEG